MKVFKYRGGSENDFDSLQNDKFWAPSVDNLNDPCEGLVNSSKIKKGVTFISKLLQFNSKSELDFLEENTENVLSFDPYYGIYSLSQNPLDELLWAHYSDSHKGFCLEFNKSELIKNDKIILADSVEYTDTPPEILFSDTLPKNNHNLKKKSGFFKSKRWSYEEEFRIVTNTNNVLIPYSPKSLTGIYFGLKMSESDKEKVLALTSEKALNYYQIKLKKDSYKLEAIKLN